MSDKQARINVLAARSFKLKLKEAIAGAGIDSVQAGYLKILELGLIQLKKEARNG